MPGGPHMTLESSVAVSSSGLKIGSTPITCPTPIIMAEPMPLAILSATECRVKLEKKGERGVIAVDTKFLHDKEY